MGFMPDEETEDFRGVVRDFLAAQSSEAQVRAVMGTTPGFDRAVWSRAANELGLQGLAIDEAFGGSGAGLMELGVIFEEMGRVLFCGPYLSTVGMAATVLQNAASEAGQAEWLPRIAAGECLATLAYAGTAEQSTLEVESGFVTGTAPYVVDGAVAELLLVTATDSEGRLNLVAVSGDSAAVRAVPLTAMDSTRTLARVDFDGADGEVLNGDALAGITRAVHIVRLLLAAEQLGAAQHALDTAVRYSKDRVQFGRAIGSFEAIKHRCADMLMDVELARSAVYHGLSVAADHESTAADLAASALLASSFCSDTFVHVAAANLQIHGGIGFTWEHSAHLYLKRAKSSSLLLGNATRQRRQLADTLGLVGAK